MGTNIPRRTYVDRHGPTKGDRVRLADTELIVEVERDLTTYGEETAFGSGGVLREGMGMSARAIRQDERGVLDLVIANALLIDHWGVIKCDVGVRDGRIVKVGKAGNPDAMDGVDPELVVGAATEVISAENMILTAGAVDALAHFVSPQLIPEALAAGTTTMIGGGTGPATGTRASGCTPGPWNIARMLQATEDWPMNFGFLGKANGAAAPLPMVEQLRAGACGLALHEDWGALPSAIDAALRIADRHGVQVSIHTDTVNEAGYVEDTIAAIAGRTIHVCHAEGAGGGHAPDIIRVASQPSVLPSSTTPTRPFTINTLDEHLEMVITRHGLNPQVPEDLAFAESRIHAETMAAEDILHDLGALSIISSGSQAMGRAGEVVMRTWQTAHKMKVQRGTLPGDSARNDNFRVKRYLAKYTINPAVAHGISRYVGSVEPGRLADLVLWRPDFFGVKPEMVVKGGVIAWSVTGDANASLPTSQPTLHRPMFGSFGAAAAANSVVFLARAGLQTELPGRLGLRKRAVRVDDCRRVGKAQMIHNSATPHIEIDPETYEVRADGALLTCEPATALPMAQRYFLF